MTADRWACAAALVGLPGMTPVRLARLLAGRDPVEAWTALEAGAPGIDRRFAGATRGVEPGRVAERYRRAGIDVLLPGDDAYPARLVGDPGAPAVLFAQGRPGALAGRRSVAVVGTRSATPYGHQVAAELGRDLASAGVTVVSGLARGIDGAAHVGALQGAGTDPGPPVAVVGTGPDVVYPASNATLWASVAERGAVLSESPLGTPPLPRAFPARNRIIAALADVVVVVECHHRGGSLHTAEAAARRGIPVGAVPGSVRSPASRGTNGLLVDGCIPIRDADDALVAVSLAAGGREAPAPVPQAGALVAARGRDRPGRRPPDDRPGRRPHDDGPSCPPPPAAGTPERAVLDAVDTEPTPVETVLLRTGLSVAAVAEAGHRLVASGHLGSGAGWWSRRR